MGDVAIRVENLSKQYRIGQRTGYGMLRESFADRLHGRRTRRRIRGKMGHRDHIWALKDISFELERGGILGIIGSNGSGKSTLLKILSRITQPTSGRAEIRGRVGSLLEVGTGFHPELTGRENVYLSGNILGMRRAEIARKFDEIVEFSGVEQFIDTPVKRYSSGMAVRLGFAVAAHLEPEVLLVDEVLAVGDAAFQKKCSGKMGEEAKKGRTVLFVSHNMGAIVTLTNQCLLLESGALSRQGSTRDVVAHYLARGDQAVKSFSDLADVERFGTGRAAFTSILVAPRDENERRGDALVVGQDLEVKLTIRARAKVEDVNVAVTVYDSTGYRVIDVNSALKGCFLALEETQTAIVEFKLQHVLLKPGTYTIGLWMGRGSVEAIDGITTAARFAVSPDLSDVRHSEVFPGVYQCGFTYSMDSDGETA